MDFIEKPDLSKLTALSVEILKEIVCQSSFDIMGSFVSWFGHAFSVGYQTNHQWNIAFAKNIGDMAFRLNL